MGRRLVLARTKRPQQAWMQVGGLLFSSNSETAFCFHDRPRDPCPGQRTLPQTLISRRGPCAGSASCEGALCGHGAPSPPPPFLGGGGVGGPLGSDWLGIGQAVFSPQWRPGRCVLHPTTRGEGLTSRSSAGSGDLVLPASPLEACPCPRISLLFLGVSLQASWRFRPGLLGRPAAGKRRPRELGWPAFALALAG